MQRHTKIGGIVTKVGENWVLIVILNWVRNFESRSGSGWKSLTTELQVVVQSKMNFNNQMC